jgi:hypothetical protein
VSIEDALVAATSPHDFKLLLEAEGRRGTTMQDVPDGAPPGDGAQPPQPPATSGPLSLVI